jgi:hypothetical protein
MPNGNTIEVRFFLVCFKKVRIVLLRLQSDAIAGRIREVLPGA